MREKINARRLSGLVTTIDGDILSPEERENAIVNLGLNPMDLFPVFDVTLTFIFSGSRTFEIEGDWRIVRINFVTKNRIFLPKDNVSYQIDPENRIFIIGEFEEVEIGDKIFVDIRFADINE
jgi:hypothetical protein